MASLYIIGIFFDDTPASNSYTDTIKWFSSLYNMGLLFRNEEDCIYDHNQRCIRKQFQDLAIEAGELDNPWDYVHEHWCVYYSVETGKLGAVFASTVYDGAIYFPSMKLLGKAIKELGEENVIKYICGIRDYKGE